ncbi:Hypothetical protein EUBELI_01375 [Lachnospira eligens ATCC 27750]|uniref:Uncharacterized protein n=1 Tax=Lachnospira eligens (strain ATCC 27750 / DSM 3376 / VPI C15-48 / C15-B4) TaxID=515620 RepID=C4Z1K9_LACE2|nr:Hypothetical protein EUBELI_01375 [[Eubacterium] eligens ATCC 27750]
MRVSPTVRLSILYPLRLNIPATRLSTPAELPTRIEKTARLISNTPKTLIHLQITFNCQLIIAHNINLSIAHL